ncbi:hypothetical protein O6H91_02G076700 [Diphasiastrum complanatum]|uniref:Uncharacterized protein n=1 Tax=Diphasiastrum complanatum TaxID=34168 RepID=A0ACC2EHB5_DIPCM|nr:hypothetical protein O6H91_02G076700 [Diphasiastrum complanatum]
MASISPLLPLPTNLPTKEIPGGYGPPFFGALSDRLDLIYNPAGPDAFFESRMKKYNSTVFRVNIPPGGIFFPDPRVIMLLDQKSFPVLFDTTKVDKTDIFTGTYMPPVSCTGGFRVLPYLDPSEERHTKLKGFCFEILKSNASKWFPEFHKAFMEAGTIWDSQLTSDGRANFSDATDEFALNFLLRSIVNRDPTIRGEVDLGDNPASLLVPWIAFQLYPIIPLGILPKYVEDFIFHNFQLPFWPVKGYYDKLYKFFKTYGTEAIDIAVTKFDLHREDAIHNLIFFVCFNTHGGIKRLFPSIVRHISDAGAELQQELAQEVQSAVKSHGGLTPKALGSMPLVESTVYEVLRIEPPVAYQYGRAKNDLIIESHDAAYKVKKGEMLGGYQPCATRDPKVFANPKAFLPKRFLGDEGQRLLQYVLWSNGQETSEPTVSNKQCAGKNFVVLISRLFVAELFSRYDYIKLGPPVGKGVSPKFFFTTLQKSQI